MSALNEPQAGNITVHSLVVEFSCVLIFGVCLLAGSKTKHTKLLPQADERRCITFSKFGTSNEETMS